MSGEGNLGVRRIYSIFGIDPEIQAYGMARFSRSSLSFKESVEEISKQRSSKFLETFYFQYGHRSIADLAHVAIILENISQLAVFEVEDESLWDGQERSTRYQDFRKNGYYVPHRLKESGFERLYHSTAEFLLSEYEYFTERIQDYLTKKIKKPKEMSEVIYKRTLRARAFDVARYWLFLGIKTSVGQIVSARTLEKQITRLLSSPFPELSEIGNELQRACRGAAFDPKAEKFAEILEGLNDFLRRNNLAETDEMIKCVKQLRDLFPMIQVAPTLLKYAEKNERTIKTYNELKKIANDIFRNAEVKKADKSEITYNDDLYDDFITTLLYKVTNYPYSQIHEKVKHVLSESVRENILRIVSANRGEHDEFLKEMNAGYMINVDILMDRGGERDLHRHRRCIQIHQDLTVENGFEIPEAVVECGLQKRFQDGMEKAACAVKTMLHSGCLFAYYLMPMAYKTRTLYKMDMGELAYIAELRTKPQGHFSYRRRAHEMYAELEKKYPQLAKLMRVANPDDTSAADMLKR